MKVYASGIFVLSLMTMAQAFSSELSKTYPIPQPVSLQPLNGVCVLDVETKVVISPEGYERTVFC